MVNAVTGDLDGVDIRRVVYLRLLPNKVLVTLNVALKLHKALALASPSVTVIRTLTPSSAF